MNARASLAVATRARGLVLAPVIALVSVAAGGCGSCEPGGAPPGEAPASPSGDVTTFAPLRGPRPRAGMRPTCRAMAVDGDVRIEPGDAEATNLAVQSRVAADWIALAAGGRVVIRDPHTARETTFRGPGRARACIDAQEEAWLPAGDFESSPGAGEAPGAEQWVVTALGVVRYAAAKLVIEARPAAVSLAVTDGTAFVWPAPDANLAGPSAPETEGWQRVAAARIAFVPKAPAATPAAAASATSACSQLAKQARDLAAALLGRAADATAPSPAADQVRVRRLARAACAVAHLRAEGLPDTDAARLSPILRQADSDWRALPTE